MLCQSSHECKSVCAERIQCMTRISTLQSTAKGIFHVRCHWSSRLLAYQSLSQPSHAGVTSVLTWPRISLCDMSQREEKQLHLEHGIDCYLRSLNMFEHFSLCLKMPWIVVIGPRENRLKAAATASWMRIPRSIQACTAFKFSTKKPSKVLLLPWFHCDCFSQKSDVFFWRKRKKNIAQMIRCRSVQHLRWAP